MAGNQPTRSFKVWNASAVPSTTYLTPATQAPAHADSLGDSQVISRFKPYPSNYKGSEETSASSASAASADHIVAESHVPTRSIFGRFRPPHKQVIGKSQRTTVPSLPNPEVTLANIAHNNTQLRNGNSYEQPRKSSISTVIAGSDSHEHSQQHNTHQLSTTPKAPPPNREYYQSLAKLLPPQFQDKSSLSQNAISIVGVIPSEAPSEPATTPYPLSISHALSAEVTTVLPPRNAMAFARETLTQDRASSSQSIFRTFGRSIHKTNSAPSPVAATLIAMSNTYSNNDPGTATTPVLISSMPATTTAGPEQSSGHNMDLSCMALEHSHLHTVQKPTPRNMKPSDGFFVFQSQPKPDVTPKAVAIPDSQSKRNAPQTPSHSSSNATRSHPLHDGLDFFQQPNSISNNSKEVPNQTHLVPNEEQYAGYSENCAQMLELNPGPTLDPIPTRGPQEATCNRLATSMDTDISRTSEPQPFDLREALRRDSARTQYKLPNMVASSSPPSRITKRGPPQGVQMTRDRLRFNRLTQFKARRLNPKVFTCGGELGLPTLVKMPTTVPVSPVFSQRRVKKRIMTESAPTAAAGRLKNVLNAAKYELSRQSRVSALNLNQPTTTRMSSRTRLNEQPLRPETASSSTTSLPASSLPSGKSGNNNSLARQPAAMGTRPVPFIFATTELQRKRALFQPTTMEPTRELETFAGPSNDH